MAEYITPRVETDPDLLLQDAFERIQSFYPDWLPSTGNLEVIMLETIARMAAQARDVASDVPTTIFRWYGANVVAIPPIDEISATTTSTWTMQDTAGYTIPDGTIVGITNDLGDLRPFYVQGDVEVTAGSSVTVTGEVDLVAVEPGEDDNDLNGTVTLIDPLAYVTDITLEDPTSGGVDAESDEDYLNRLAAELQLLSPRLITPRDYVIFAERSVGDGNALALDGYNADDDTDDNERTITVVVRQDDGSAQTTEIKDQLDEDMQAQREVNFEIFVADPLYDDVKVQFEAVAFAQFDPDEVNTRAEAAVTDFLDGGQWGLLPYSDDLIWVSVDTIRFQDLSTVLNNVEGLSHWTSLELAFTADAFGTSDLTLTGPRYLPNLTSVSGTTT